MRKRTLSSVVITTVLAAISAAAQNAPVHVLASNGVKAVIEDLQKQAEAAIKRPLMIEYDTSSVVKKKIESGTPFDVAILTSDVIDDLAKAAKIDPGSRMEIARCGIGVGIRAGAPKPDIKTTDALKKTLLAAKSVTYAENGASRTYILQMFNKFGIADAMKAKTVLAQGSDASNAHVADGSAEMILTLVSEILPAPGVQLVGPLPESVQHYVNFAAGVSKNSQNVDAAKALTKFFSGPAVVPTLKAKGMQAAQARVSR